MGTGEPRGRDARAPGTGGCADQDVELTEELRAEHVPVRANLAVVV